MRPILIAEDDPLNRALMAHALTLLNHEVVTARDGQEALELFQALDGQISLLVTDISMPDMDGFALAERLRKRDPGIRVLFVTAYCKNLNAERWPDADILLKPFSFEDLMVKVISLLGLVSVPNRPGNEEQADAGFSGKQPN